MSQRDPVKEFAQRRNAVDAKQPEPAVEQPAEATDDAVVEAARRRNRADARKPRPFTR
jgi:hypothetical protein